MKSPKENLANNLADTGNTHPERYGRVLKVVGWSLCGLIVLVAILLTGITLWLTPNRLSQLLNREASEWLDADVKVSGVRFTLWSSFPHFRLEADSLRVTSHTLDSISPLQRDSLPAGYERLLSTGRIHGSVNLLHLLKGDITMRDLEVEYLDLNIVDLNDSLNNYNILPSDSRGSFKVPPVSTNSLRLPHMRPIRYFSALSATELIAPIDSARLKSTGKNKYHLLFGGEVSLRVDSMTILRDFPFLLSGDMALGFRPFRVSLSDFGVALAQTQGKVDLNLDLGEKAGVDGFSYSLLCSDPLALLKYFPGLQLPYLQNIKGYMGLNLSAHLTSPYKFSASTLPSIEVDFSSNQGNMTLDFGGDENLRLNNIDLDGSFLFNGKTPADSRILLKNLNFETNGTALSLSGSLTGLLGTPRIEANLDAEGSLASLARYLPAIKDYELQGDASLATRMTFALPLSGNMLIDNPRISGLLTLRRIKGHEKGLEASADSILIAFGGKAGGVGTTMIKNGDLKVSMDARGLAVADRTARYSSPRITGSSNITIDKTTGLPRLNTTLSMPLLTAKGSSTGITVRGTELDFSTDPHPFKINKKTSIPDPADSAALARIPHTPEYLMMKLPENLRMLYARLGLKGRLRIASGKLEIPSFPVDNSFSNLNIGLSKDALEIGNIKVRSQQSAAALSGRISGLWDFITTGQATPLDACLTIAIDTVSINQLAHAYSAGLVKTKGSAEQLSAPKPATLTDADTTALLIPRNLTLHVDASAKETRYTNLHLYDLSTTLDVAEGAAHINDLKIFADFGHAYLDLFYDSSDVLNMGVNANLGLMDIDLTRFFERFHTLLLMMPQMKNLSGNISAEADLGLHMYPDMYADVPSLTSKIGVQGRNLKVHQDPFIRKITRMMLITTDDDLHIANMNVRASAHDNLLELYPFTCSFSGYEISMQGINNFNGKLYYHIGLKKSPLHIPFGINIQGMFHHPQLRFGGAGYKVEQGAKVAREVMEDNSFNIVRELKYYLREFVRKAAESPE